MAKGKKIDQVQTVIVEEPSQKTIPIIKSPSRFAIERIGRGFSLSEIKNAAVPLDEVIKMNLPIDRRRKSTHQENIEFLGAKFREVVKTKEIELVEVKKIEKKVKDKVSSLNKQLSGLSKKDVIQLVDGGVSSVEQLADEDAKVLAKDIDEPVQKVLKWIKEAKRSLVERKYDEAIADLKKIKDISPSNARRMAALGIINLEILADEKSEDLSKDMGVKKDIAEAWIGEAKNLIGKKSKADIERVTPIGKIGKKVEDKQIGIEDILNKKELNKLQSLGIETLETLSDEDPLELSSILGINKNIILGWINEARKLLNKKPLTLEKKKQEIEIKIKESKVVLENMTEESSEVNAEKKVDPKQLLNELTTVKGLGKTSAEKIISSEMITCLEDFKNADVAELSKKCGISESKLKKFIEEANK